MGGAGGGPTLYAVPDGNAALVLEVILAAFGESRLGSEGSFLTVVGWSLLLRPLGATAGIVGTPWDVDDAVDVRAGIGFDSSVCRGTGSSCSTRRVAVKLL